VWSNSAQAKTRGLIGVLNSKSAAHADRFRVDTLPSAPASLRTSRIHLRTSRSDFSAWSARPRADGSGRIRISSSIDPSSPPCCRSSCPDLVIALLSCPRNRLGPIKPRPLGRFPSATRGQRPGVADTVAAPIEASIQTCQGCSHVLLPQMGTTAPTRLRHVRYRHRPEHGHCYVQNRWRWPSHDPTPSCCRKHIKTRLPDLLMRQLHLSRWPPLHDVYPWKKKQKKSTSHDLHHDSFCAYRGPRTHLLGHATSQPVRACSPLRSWRLRHDRHRRGELTPVRTSIGKPPDRPALLPPPCQSYHLPIDTLGRLSDPEQFGVSSSMSAKASPPPPHLTHVPPAEASGLPTRAALASALADGSTSGEAASSCTTHPTRRAGTTGSSTGVISGVFQPPSIGTARSPFQSLITTRTA